MSPPAKVRNYNTHIAFFLKKTLTINKTTNSWSSKDSEFIEKGAERLRNNAYESIQATQKTTKINLSNVCYRIRLQFDANVLQS